jgi:hypothetical protein
MSDASSPLAPRNSVARFGVSFVGPPFEWGYTEPGDDGELVLRTKAFRAHPGLSFEEQLAYTRSLSMLQATAVVEQRQLEAAVEKITAMPPEEDPTEALEDLAQRTADGERKRWEMQVDQTVMLVAPADREEFRALISQGNPADVRALKEHLVEVVITRTQKQVEAVGRVDPTSQPSSSA